MEIEATCSVRILLLNEFAQENQICTLKFGDQIIHVTPALHAPLLLQRNDGFWPLAATSRARQWKANLEVHARMTQYAGEAESPMLHQDRPSMHAGGRRDEGGHQATHMHAAEDDTTAMTATYLHGSYAYLVRLCHH